MKQEFCPNKRSKEFKELSEIFGEDKAYFLWMRNKGNPLDKAPNGADSKLFKSLLDYYEGDYVAAINAKSNIYRNEFLTWFGNWGVDVEQDFGESSKVVDENGEPLIVYHGSEEDFEEFNPNHKPRASLSSILKNKIYFSGQPYVARQYASSKERKDYFKYTELQEAGLGFEFIAEALGFDPYDEKQLDAAAKYMWRLEDRNFENHFYACFLNIKNPVVKDLGGKLISSLSKTDRDEINNSDGAIVKNVDETLHQYRGQIHDLQYIGTTYIVSSSDQIKHIENRDGKYTGPNIYHEHQTPRYNKSRDSKLESLIGKKDASVIDILSIIEANEHLAPIIEMLKQRGYKTNKNRQKLLDDISVVVEAPIGMPFTSKKYNGRRAFYNADKKTIYINGIADFENGDSSSVLMHEILHAITVNRILSNKNLYVQFENILKRYQEQYKKENGYYDTSYTNEHPVEEFIADVWSDEALITRLNRYEGEGDLSLWQKIKQFFIKIVFGEIRDESMLAEASVLLDKVLDSKESEYSTHSYYEHGAKESDTIQDDINNSREEYINSVVEQYKQDSKLEGDELANALLKVKDDARRQFDLDEIGRLRVDQDMSSQQKQVALSLLYRDLEIVTGLQHTESIAKNYDKEAFDTIKEGTKTRLRSHLNRVTKQTRIINELKEQIAQMESINTDDVDAMFKQIEQFLSTAEQEILRTRRFIDENLVGQDISTWDPQQINYIRYDFLGYYDGILTSLRQMLTNNSKIAELNKQRVTRSLELMSLSDEEKANLSPEDTQTLYYQDMLQWVENMQRVVDSMQQDYQDKVAIPYAKKVLTDFVYESDAVKDKEAFIRNMMRWIEQDTLYGDLAAGEIALGMASRSRSSVINIVEKMMSDMEFEKNRQILKEGNELIRLYNKIRPVGSQIDFRNFQKLFMEMDGEDGTSGKYTGYFVRDRNYGKFYKDKDNFEKSLREKYAEKGLKWTYNDYTDSIELIFPEEDHTAEHSVYNQYYDELDEWLDKHCERRYTLEYYKKKRRFLSPAALQAQSMIQRQIDILSQKAMDESGFVDPNKLTQNERQRLTDLRKQKRELACPYIFNSLSDGTVILQEKTGEDAEIARQISSWNKFIADHVKYKHNDAKFQEALSKIESGSDAEKLFLAYNRIQIINPEFWKYVLKNQPKQSEEYNELAARHRAIVEHLKYRQGWRQPNLDMLGFGLNTDASAWQELQRLEQRMDEIKIRPEEKEPTPEYINSILVHSTKYTDKQFLTMLQERWNYEIQSDESLAEVFRKLFTYTDYKGRQRFLKVFNFIKPTSFDIKNENGETIPTLVYQYSSQFSELDESSDFVNKRYDKTIKASMQPKVRKSGTKRRSGVIDYTNDNYQKILENDGYKQLYDKLIDIMEKANSMIPQKALERRYLLPQITGRGMSILGRSRSAADMFASLNYGLQDWTGLKFTKNGPEFDDSLMQQDTDVSTNWDLPRRPDGTIVNNIPIRFVKRLEDPSIISSDVIGSVLLYYDMALNYKIKSEKLPALELIQEAINPNTKTKQSSKNKLPKQYQKMKQLMDYRMYGKQSKLGGDDTKSYSKFQKSTMQISKKFRSLASMSMLALNFTTIEVGYLDALLASIADAVGGKYFTLTDLRKGYWEAMKAMPQIIANLGNPVVDNWMVAAMQYNQLSKSNSDIFGRTDQSRWSRLLAETRMGGYTMADYLINTMILGATYNHYRLLDMPDGKSKKFLSKSDAIDVYTKHGYTENQAIQKWESADTTLKQAYYCEDGLLKVKDDFKKYINSKLENQIAGRLRDRTAVYNGIIPQTEKAAIQQNVFGSFLTLMRNFYVNTYWERARAGYDYATEEELQSSKLGMYSADSAGSVNFETGEFGNGLWFSALKGLYKYVCNVKALLTGKDLRQLTYDQKYAVKRILAEVAIIGACAFAMVWSIAFARTNDYDDDKNPIWTVNIFDPEGEDRGILEFNGSNSKDKILNWTRWKLALLATRTFTERSTFYWPGTVTELISSPSTAKSYLDDLGYSLELFMDLFEINGHDRNEMVTSGGYKGMTRGTRDIMKITGATGIDNVIRNWHTSGIKSTLNWYQGISPNNFLIPNKSTWEKEQGITKSKKSKSKRRY